MERANARPALVPVKGGLNPAYLLIPVLLGLFIGLGLGLRDRITGSSVDLDNNYIQLAATLYGQNPTQEVAQELRDHLVALGIANPSLAVLTLADQDAASRDPDLKSEAEGLRIFGQALSGAAAPLVSIPTPSVTTLPTYTPLGVLSVNSAGSTPSPTSTTVTATPTVLAEVLAPTDSPTPAPSVTPTSTRQPTRTATARKATSTPRRATATPTKIAGTTINKNGIASTGTTKNVLVRKGPTTSASVIVTIPNGSAVYVLKAVSGEAIIKGSPTWYLVNWTNSSGKVIQGYIYGLLVKVG